MKSKMLDATTTIAEISNLKKRRPFISQFLPARLIINYKNPFIHGTLLIKKKRFQILETMMKDLYMHKITNYLQILLKNKYKVKY